MQHVDAGMGLERMTAVLNGSMSNYDPDLFPPIFDAISHKTGAPPYGGRFGTKEGGDLDTSYRVVADHIRMVSACLADGMFPEFNHRLHAVIRRLVHTTNTAFHLKQV